MNLGDTVRVNSPRCRWDKQEGTIVEVAPHMPMPYVVRFSDRWRAVFREGELDLVAENRQQTLFAKGAGA